MSSATAALRIERTDDPIDLLEEVVATSTDSAEIAVALLAAIADLIPSSGGAVLLPAPTNDALEVAATSAPDAYPLGKQSKRIGRAPKGGRVLPLRARGREFGQVLLLDAAKVEPRKVELVNHVLLVGAILDPITEAEALRNQVAESNAIVEVGQVLTGFLAMEDVLSYVVYLAESLVQGNAATIALLSSDGGELILKNSTGSLRGAEGDSIPVAKSLMGWVVRKGQPVVTPSMSDDPRSSKLAKGQGPALVVPLHINGETVGAFLVARLADAQPFSQNDLETLQRMAAYAAIAIQNARLYQEQADAAETLRKQATELQDTYSELHQQQQQLIVSEKMAALGRITGGIAHEINSPLGGILNSLRTARGYADEYRSSIGDPEITAEDHEAIAGDIISALTLAESAGAKVAQFVRSIKSQTRSGAGSKSTFDPAAEVESTIVLLQHRFKKENVGVYTELEKGLTLDGDQGKFGVVIQNLVSNAIDAYDGAAGEIWVRLRSEDEALHLQVADQGTGIPEEIQSRIFDYLFTTKDVGKGTGLGLAMVHSVVTGEFKGTIDLDSTVGIGTTFNVRFPVNQAPE
ncbi:MAG: GAF domain-containing sensor histidine kinase [Gemmatimonadota bacterium]